MKNLTFLEKLTYGVYVVSTLNSDGKHNGQIANTVFQVTSEPVQIAICINKENLTHIFLEESKVFSVSVLSKDTPMTFIGKFGFKSGRNINKFENTEFFMSANNVPVVKEYSIAWLEARIISKLDVGTHTLFIGEVLDGNILNDNEPMTYDYYHKIKSGKSPKTAPTYIPLEQK